MEVGEAIVTGAGLIFGSGGVVYSGFRWFGRHVDRLQRRAEDSDKARAAAEVRFTKALEEQRAAHEAARGRDLAAHAEIVRHKDAQIGTLHDRCEERVEKAHQATIRALHRVAGLVEHDETGGSG